MESGKSNTVGIIGAGQMGEAIGEGLLSDNKVEKGHLFLCDHKPDKAKYFESKGISFTTNIDEIIKKSKTIILCAKPLDIPQILLNMRPLLSDDQLIISIAAGITLEIMESTLNKNNPIIRVMPNNCCIVKASATVYCLGKNAKENHAQYFEYLMSSMGMVSRTQEKLMDTFTGFTGSGPAYAYLFIQSLADGAVRNGVPRDQAIKFAAQILYGAGKLVLESGKHPAHLIDAVMTPAGTTAEGMLILEKSAFRANVIKAVTSASKRSQELGQGLGEIKYLYKKNNLENAQGKKHGKKGFCQVKSMTYECGFRFLRSLLKSIK